jgi:hypothetical protein
MTRTQTSVALLVAIFAVKSIDLCPPVQKQHKCLSLMLWLGFICLCLLAVTQRAHDNFQARSERQHSLQQCLHKCIECTCPVLMADGGWLHAFCPCNSCIFAGNPSRISSSIVTELRVARQRRACRLQFSRHVACTLPLNVCMQCHRQAEAKHHA